MSRDLAARRLLGWVDPATVHAHVARASAHTFWLDAGPDVATGWSWVGTGSPESDPDVVRAVVCGGATDDAGPGGRFRGGWVGWLDYEGAAARAGAPTVADAVGGGARWLRAERFVALDHTARETWAFATGDEIDAFAREIEGCAGTAPKSEPPAPTPVPARARHRPHDYAALIERCREAIYEGDAYQLCLTTRFEVEASVDPVAAYTRLRAMTPAHHGGLLRIGDVALASASPEQFLQVDGATVRTRPIKGTRPRGEDALADARLAAELAASEKERAENVMIVDLMRNDLSRVCEPATVGVDALLAVESYPHVHQLVSTVSGRLRVGMTVGELWDASFPAGSMTGAPKLSAMTILNDLEAAPRGVFSGCFGWVGTDGALDLAMVIRSIVVHPDGAYVGAGGGITWRSIADEEVREVGVKARAPLAALGASLPSGW
jgi:anthranilate synthase component 1